MELASADTQKYFYVGLNCIPSLRGRRLKRLLETFGAPEKLWKASRQEMHEAGRLSTEFIETFFEQKQRVSVEKEFQKAESLNVSIIALGDDRYPALLREIYDPPPVLYVKGEIKTTEDANSIAVVGSRKATEYGLNVAEKISAALAQAGFTIVSGLARGIDTKAHEGTLKAGGRTLAVLGNGHDVMYPKENKALSEKISASGAVLTEFPFGTQPHAMNFPMRNRIISGLSRGVIVVQAGERSGATITADFALEQGREVFAVPGSVYLSQSKGTHRLLKEGATLVESVSDVLQALGIPSVKTEEKEAPQLQGVEKMVYDALSYDPVALDDLVESLQFPVQRISSSLMILEAQGHVRQLPGKFFVKTR